MGAVGCGQGILTKFGKPNERNESGCSGFSETHTPLFAARAAIEGTIAVFSLHFLSPPLSSLFSCCPLISVVLLCRRFFVFGSYYLSSQSQCSLHPTQGILPLHRLSLRHVDAFQRVSGATVLSNILIDSAQSKTKSTGMTISRDALGFVGKLKQKSLGGKRYNKYRISIFLFYFQFISHFHFFTFFFCSYIFVKPSNASTLPSASAPSSPARPPVYTLILRGATEHVMAELLACVKNAVTVLTNLAHSPFAVPGGGCWELHLAHYIRQKVSGVAVSFVFSMALQRFINCSFFLPDPTAATAVLRYIYSPQQQQ